MIYNDMNIGPIRGWVSRLKGYAALGFGQADAIEWSKAGFKATHAKLWLEAGYTPETARTERIYTHSVLPC